MCEYAEMVSFVHNIIRLDSRKQYWTRCHHIGLNDKRILLPFFGMTNNVVWRKVTISEDAPHIDHSALLHLLLTLVPCTLV